MVPRVGAQLGVIVTASHNPPEFNGLKCIAADGLEVERSVEEAIEVATERGVAPTVPFSGVGTVLVVSDGAHRYTEGILAQVDVERLRQRHFTVVLDCGNGASVETSPHLLRRLGCRVITLNGHLDGTFPGHLSEPTEANTRDAQHAVPALGADLGIIHDGDADRAVFVDHTGRYVPGKRSWPCWHGTPSSRPTAGSLVSPVSASQSLEDTVAPSAGPSSTRASGPPRSRTRWSSSTRSSEARRTEASLRRGFR